MHRNPVKDGLVQEPQVWAWSSYRSYAYEELGKVKINQWPVAELKFRPSGISTAQFCRNFAKESDGLYKVEVTIGLDSIRPTLPARSALHAISESLDPVPPRVSSRLSILDLELSRSSPQRGLVLSGTLERDSEFARIGYLGI